MRIRISRAQAVSAIIRGELVWFGSADSPESAHGMLTGRKSRRQAAEWLRSCAWAYPRHAKMAYWVSQ